MRSAIAPSFAAAVTLLRSRLWLSPRNRFFHDVAAKVAALPVGRIRGNSLHKYIAASGPLHALEATRYLGRSLQALLLQDFAIAKHLAYYAELRATMGLLATEGIGVFNGWHVALTTPYFLEKVPQKIGTHEFAWEAFNAWSTNQSSSTILSGVINGWGVSLGDFFDASYPGAALQPYISDILNAWGIDLQSYLEDRKSRNEASYRPSFPRLISAGTSPSPLDFVRQLWAMLEPNGSHAFELVDRPLIAGSFKATEAQIPSAVSLADRLARQGVSQASTIAEYVLRFDARSSLLFKLARLTSSRDPAEHAMAMISRAVLLTRISIGSCSRHFSDSGIVDQDLDWWFQSIASSCGITAEPFSDAMDLWDDVRVALEDSALIAPLATQYELLTLNSGIVATLQQYERVSVWGFGANSL